MEGSKRTRLDEHAQHLIRQKASRFVGEFGFTRDDREDIMQELALDLLLRLPKFDPARASLRTFVNRVLDRRLASIIRSRFQEKRDFRRSVCSFDDEGNDVAETLTQDDHDLRTETHACTEAERLDLHADFTRALAELPHELRSLAERLLVQSITQAARELGVPRSTLSGSGIAQLRNAFENSGLREYL